MPIMKTSQKTGMCAAGVNLPLHCLHNLSILSLKFIKSFPILSWCKRKATKLNTKETSEVSSDSESLPFRLLNNVNNDVSDDFSDSYRTF